MRPTSAQRSGGIAGYGDHADLLAAQYESISFEDVHRDVRHFFPHQPGRALDVGAGTGRDAAALARIGHRVVAVEPTQELRTHGQRLHPEPGIEWLDDVLPTLDRVFARGERFDLILLTAVWMHLDGEERRVAMGRLKDLLASSGLIVMSLRHGPVPAGRQMFDVSPQETCHLAEESGLQVLHQSEREDMLGRADVRWTSVVLRNML